MQRERLKKIADISAKIVAWLIIVFAAFMVIFTVFTVMTFDRNERSVFGFRFYIVQTDSMSRSENNADMDVHFNAGDVIVVKQRKDNTKFEEGDIISFMSANTDSYGETITHMVREVRISETTGEVIGYVTYGTNTGVNDEALVEPDYILGEYSAKLPAVGRFFAFVKTTPGYITCILIPFLLVILYNGINVIRLFKKYKGEQTAAINAEREQIEKEREENRRMMEELLALKAQLSQQNGTVESSDSARLNTEDDVTADSDETD